MRQKSRKKNNFMDNNELFQKALNYAYFYLKFRNRTEKEISRYLEKKAKRFYWTETTISAVIKTLKEQDLIDDKKFIQWFVNQRNLFKPKSVFILKNELFKLGVAKELIDEYFSDHPQNETELAYKTLLPRWQRFFNLSSRERFKKASQFLLRRGFSFEIVKRTIAKIEGKE